ncbi:MAG: KpsF/GutQ family protein [Enterovirga sp.]|jgi:arabinose-5-phosphate isomerase|nr:KpsF/GutQ family protein [Enterovirga sp.]
MLVSENKAVQPTAPLDDADSRARSAGLRTLQLEIAGLHSLAEALVGELGASFDAAVALIRRTTGRVIVSGIGKSGHIGRKIAATLASTGTPAYFVHATEASHGDLGVITSDDVILALSWSGETAELGDLTEYSRRFSVGLIAVTSRPGSTLGQAADIVLALPRVKEACPHDLAPTTSSVMQLAIGDALAMALLDSRGFTASDFEVFHPGGTLAARLKSVDQIMHSGDEIPLVRTGTGMSDVLLVIAGKRFGCVGVVDADGKLVGIVTDGDLRRHMSDVLLAQTVDAVMTPDPITVGPKFLASSALEMMNRMRIMALFVVDGRRPAGILHLHDLLRAGVA